MHGNDPEAQAGRLLVTAASEPSRAAVLQSRGAQSGNAASQPSSWPSDEFPAVGNFLFCVFLVFQVLGYLTAVVHPGAF